MGGGVGSYLWRDEGSILEPLDGQLLTMIRSSGETYRSSSVLSQE